MFNFAWTAYEAAIEISAAGEFVKDKLPVRARKILQAEASEAAKIAGLDPSYRVARLLCGRVPSSEVWNWESIQTKYRLACPPAAAELVRISSAITSFTGEDGLPIYYSSRYRFYAITRVLLLLTQYLVLRRISAPAEDVFLSANREELGREPAALVLRQLHYADRRWRTSTPETLYGPPTRDLRCHLVGRCGRYRHSTQLQEFSGATEARALLSLK